MKRTITLLFALAAFLTMGAQSINGTWNGVLQTGNIKLSLAFNIVTDSLGKSRCTFDSPNQGAKGIPTKLDFISKDSISVSIPQINFNYSGKLSNNIIKGFVKQNGISVPVDLTSGKVLYNRPQNPTFPLPYKVEEVSFENESGFATLYGTLSYPVGYKNGDKVPVVLMVSGSGQQNRHEEIYEHKPFLVIADYFARHGIATLRYDDRGVGKSTGDPYGATTQDFADDAKAGLKMLKRMDKFCKVGILGHSEGGSIAFMLGAKKRPDFIISMAGCGVKGDTILAFQTNKVFESLGMKPSVTSNQIHEQQKVKENPWLLFFTNYDPSSDIKATKCPVMAINGEKDTQVPCELNLGKIKELLDNDKKNLIKQYPDLNHLFQHCKTGMNTEYSTITETVSPEVLSDMANWVNSL